MAINKPKKESWTRAHKLQVAALCVAIVGVIAGYCYFHFKASGAQMNGANGNVNQGGTQINNGGNGTVINGSPGATVNITQDYIEGTTATHKAINDYFSFGYAIIHLNEQGERQINEVHSKRLDWKLDWERVKIEPDFVAGNVKWTVVPISAKYLDGEVLFQDSTFKLQTPFQVGAWPIMAFGNRELPTIFVSVLSANQRNPVFVIGFRIASENDIPPRL